MYVCVTATSKILIITVTNTYKSEEKKHLRMIIIFMNQHTDSVPVHTATVPRHLYTCNYRPVTNQGTIVIRTRNRKQILYIRYILLTAN